MKADWNAEIYFTLDNGEDPSVAGTRYEKPFVLESTTAINAKSKLWNRWGPLCTWVVHVSPSGAVMSKPVKDENRLYIEAEYTGEPLKVWDFPTKRMFSVQGVYKDGKKKTVDDFSLDKVPDIKEPGTYYVTIGYGDETTDCKVDVIGLIKLVSRFVGGVFEVGETLTNGMFRVTAIYSDGSEEEIDDFSLSKRVFTEAGLQNVTITYKGVESTYRIDVFGIMRLKAKFVENDFEVGDTLTNDMFHVVAVYSDGSEKEVKDFTLSQTDFDGVGSYDVTVSYDGKEAICKVEVGERFQGPVTEKHTPNLDFSVGMYTWDKDKDYGLNSRRYSGGRKVVVSNIWTDLKA